MLAHLDVTLIVWDAMEHQIQHACSAEIQRTNFFIKASVWTRAH